MHLNHSNLRRKPLVETVNLKMIKFKHKVGIKYELLAASVHQCWCFFVSLQNPAGWFSLRLDSLHQGEKFSD